MTGEEHPEGEATLPQGKLPPTLLSEVLAGSAPLPPDVVLGPGLGEDAAVVDLGTDHLVITTDPITLTGSGLGPLAVAVNANDIAVMGVKPRWFLATVLLPAGTTESVVRSLFADLHQAVAELDVALVGGHTEVTAAVIQPVISGVMVGTAAPDEIVRTAGARPGDVIVQIGAAPIEGAGVLADLLSIPWPPPGVVLPSVSVVDMALAAARCGATAMHDPTEGGLASGLHELAGASNVAIVVDRSAVVWFEPASPLLEAAGADPWTTLASGTVVAAFSPADSSAAVQVLHDLGYVAEVIATVTAGAGVADTSGAAMLCPARDEVARIVEARDLGL